MADYWKSRDKHWCEYCKTWTQGDPQSIKLHENGKKHQESVKLFFATQKKQKADAVKQQEELAATLASIEAAAKAAHSKDAAAFARGAGAGAGGPQIGRAHV